MIEEENWGGVHGASQKEMAWVMLKAVKLWHGFPGIADQDG